METLEETNGNSRDWRRPMEETNGDSMDWRDWRRPMETQEAGRDQWRLKRLGETIVETLYTHTKNLTVTLPFT